MNYVSVASLLCDLPNNNLKATLVKELAFRFVANDSAFNAFEFVRYCYIPALHRGVI